MSVVDLAGDGVARDDELCDDLAARASDGIPFDDEVASGLAQWCGELDRDPPAIVLPTAALAAVARRRHARRRTARVIGVAAAVVVICLGGLTLLRRQDAPAPVNGGQIVSATPSNTGPTVSGQAGARVQTCLENAQRALEGRQWAAARTALGQAESRLPAVSARDGRAELSTWLASLRRRLARALAGRRGPGTGASMHHGTAAKQHDHAGAPGGGSGSEPALATAGSSSRTGDSALHRQPVRQAPSRPAPSRTGTVPPGTAPSGTAHGHGEPGASGQAGAGALTGRPAPVAGVPAAAGDQAPGSASERIAGGRAPGRQRHRPGARPLAPRVACTCRRRPQRARPWAVGSRSPRARRVAAATPRRSRRSRRGRRSYP